MSQTTDRYQSDADLLASVTDEHIASLLASRDVERRRIIELEAKLDDARSDLADTDAAIDRWLADVRAELSILQLGPDEDVRVLSVRVSANTYGAVDADLIVRVGDKVVEAEVTLCPDPGRPTRRRRHPLDTWGSLDNWASDALVKAIHAAESSSEDFDRIDLIREIVAAVDEAAEKSGL